MLARPLYLAGKMDAFFLQLPKNILEFHRTLGIPVEYSNSCILPLCEEPNQLVATERDFYDRPQQLTPESFAAWTAMKLAAANSQVDIFIISAYRSAQYQADLLAKKLSLGAAIEDILTVNAAPGFSEHHTGRAIDIGTYGCGALVEDFENTIAFQWLEKNAADFCFTMSYPRDNAFGIIYEPWHWCFDNN
ncbi:MAG: D-alanyl-D-alanine carboxypeptidase [Pseudohongiellaceae bacterium]